MNQISIHWSASVSRVPARDAAAALRAKAPTNPAALKQFNDSTSNIDAEIAAVQPDPNGLVNVSVGGATLGVAVVPEPL